MRPKLYVICTWLLVVGILILEWFIIANLNVNGTSRLVTGHHCVSVWNFLLLSEFLALEFIDIVCGRPDAAVEWLVFQFWFVCRSVCTNFGPDTCLLWPRAFVLILSSSMSWPLPSWEANNHLSNQAVSCLLGFLKFHYHLHESPLLGCPEPDESIP